MAARVALLLFLTLIVGGNAGARDVAFVPQVYGDGAGDIYAMNADGTGRTNLTNSPQDEVSPVWSPDGTKVAFVRYQRWTPDQGWIPDIWVMNSDGSGQDRITSGEFPAWSPDGSKIAFSLIVGNTHDVLVMNADGSGQTNLTNSPQDEISPDWSPDGTKIAYTTGRGYGSDISVMNADIGMALCRFL